MANRHRVALLVETSKSYGRGLLRGISRYAQTHQRWSIFVEECGLTDSVPAWLRRWRGHGIILRTSTAAPAMEIARRGLPVVYLGESRETGLPMFHSDDHLIVGQIVDHLVERGFREFGYVGIEGVVWSDVRCQLLLDRLDRLGHPCQVCQLQPDRSHTRGWLGQARELSRWLKTLPRPVAVFACYDVLGVRVLDACRDAGIAVPEEVAVVGVDNDPLLCQLADPPLSSVAHNLERIGYAAAALLDQLMAGQPPPSPRLVSIEPAGVVTRQSTDVLAIADPQVARALQFIRQHACDGICVADVVTAVPIHRATLKRRVERILGRSPKAEIMRLQLERVKQLLRETDFVLERVARMTGFRHAEYMSVIFKKKMGQTPGEFRQANRGNGTARD